MASVYRGLLFENFAHKQLHREGTYNYRILCEPKTQPILESFDLKLIKKEVDIFYNLEEILNNINSTCYGKPSSSNLASFDSFANYILPQNKNFQSSPQFLIQSQNFQQTPPLTTQFFPSSQNVQLIPQISVTQYISNQISNELNNIDILCQNFEQIKLDISATKNDMKYDIDNVARSFEKVKLKMENLQHKFNPIKSIQLDVNKQNRYLILFQMTVSKSHKIKKDAINKVLLKIDKDVHVIFMFVVPKDIEHLWTKTESYVGTKGTKGIKLVKGLDDIKRRVTQCVMSISFFENIDKEDYTYQNDSDSDDELDSDDD